MSKYDIDNELIKAFEDASLEDVKIIMEDVDPSEFKIKNAFANRRIQNKVMNEIEGKAKKTKKTKKTKIEKAKRTYIKAIGYIAAAVILVCSVFVFSRTEACAKMMNLIFSFVPGKGIVEMEDPEGSEISAATSIYELVERGKTDSDNLCSVTYNYGTADCNTLELSYNFRMTAVEYDVLDSINANAYDTDESSDIHLKQLVDYYNELGYQNYVTYTDDLTINKWYAVNGVQSELYCDGLVCPQISSTLSFGEVGGGVEATVIESYDISDVNATEGKAYTLKINDFESTFTVSAVAGYSSEEDLLNSQSVDLYDDIQIICDTHWEDEWLIADFYVSCDNEDVSIAEIWPCDATGDSYYPYAEINGKRYESYNTDVFVYDGKEGRPFQLAFEIPESERSGDITIHIPSLELDMDIDPIQIDFSKMNYGTDDINETYITPYGNMILTEGFRYTKDNIPDDIKLFEELYSDSEIIGAYFELIDASETDTTLISLNQLSYNVEVLPIVISTPDCNYFYIETDSNNNVGILTIEQIRVLKETDYQFNVTVE